MKKSIFSTLCIDLHNFKYTEYLRGYTPVRVHMLEVITLLKYMEIIGALIDEETQVDMVLETLSDSFDTF